jgi:hypothetical protein
MTAADNHNCENSEFCPEHSGRGERLDGIENKMEDKFKTLFWVLGGFGSVLSGLFVVIISQNTTISNKLNDLSTRDAVVTVELAAVKKDLELQRRDFETLKNIVNDLRVKQ